MTDLASIAARARATGDAGLLASAIPYCRWLGISASLDGDSVLGRLTYQDMLVGNPSVPALHGGTIGALLESTAIFEIVWRGAGARLPKTIDITVDYLRSARPADVWARGTITKQGRRVVNVHVEAYQDDAAKPVATADAHFLVDDE